MASLVRRRRDDRAIRDVALRVTEGCRPMDARCRMLRVLDYARRTLRYEMDPRGGELIHDPVDTIGRIGSMGVAAGDCDDGAVFISAMLESLGIRTRLAAVSARPDRRLHHVAVEARDRSGFWIYLDPFLRDPSVRFTRLMRVSV
jgi:transglutaminase-like putative cysteine protease